MRSIIRLAAAGALALPIMIGFAGLASADVEYDHGFAAAGPDGSALHNVASGANADGEAYFYELFMGAGPDGAGVFEQFAYTDGESAYYSNHWSHAGDHGVATGYTDTSADDENWNDHHDD